MIIISKPSWNHSNRLFQAIRFEAFCLEKKIRFYNPSFWDMQHYYFENNFFDRYLYKLVGKLIKLKMINPVDFSGPDNYDIALKRIKNGKGLKFCGGWFFPHPELVKKHRGFFKEKYQLKQVYYNNNLLLEKLNRVKETGRIAVGIHIRRGDYKTWENGKYYYTDNVYTRVMDEMSIELKYKFDKEPFYIIFSNEKTSFENGKHIEVSHEEWYIDHLLMSRCNYLIGPPSTFTLWASYIGEAKYYLLENAESRIDLDNFKNYTG